MSRDDTPIFARRLTACGAAVVLGLSGLQAEEAPRPAGTPIDLNDFAPSVRAQVRPEPAPTNPPAYRAPLVGRVAADGDMVYVLSDPPESGLYRHPAGLFVLRFPRAWRVIRSATADFVSHIVSPDTGKTPPKQLRTGVRVMVVVMSDVFRRQQMSAAAALNLILPSFTRDEPGMKLIGRVTETRVGSLPAATCVMEGTLKDTPGETRREIVVVEKEGVVFQVTGFAPAREFAAFRPILLKIIADSSFGRTGLQRQKDALPPHRIVEQYKGSVVSISAFNDEGGGYGSGFIISRDGYVITNYHVAFDTRTHQPMKTFFVEWDQSLRRPKVEARLIGGKWRLSPYERQHGTDVALLKIPAGDYTPLPLSPLAEVTPGDGVVTLGFPSRGLIEGISLTVTTGVVTRFNRGPQGDVQSIYSDAAITHGSSGGPCVSLITGGVIGLNSFGTDVQLDPRQARLNDLIKYHGVVPIDAAIREFPLACTLGVGTNASGFDFFDCLELSKYLISVGSLTAAEQLALRAVTLEPQQPLARMRLGEARYALALDQRATNGEAGAKAQGLIDQARKAYSEAIARNPKQASALAALARIEVQQNRLAEATALAQRAAEADPEGWEGNLLLAEICLRQSRLDEALRHVDQAKAVVGGMVIPVHVTAAEIYAARNDIENSRKEWAAAARISPVFLTARLGVASYFEATREFDKAVAEYNRILADFPENGTVLGRIGLALNAAGRTPEALDYFAKSIARCKAAAEAPDESVLMYFGDALLQQPDSVVAVPTFATYLFYHRNGQYAALASMKLADIHRAHGAHGLASAHARMAAQLGRDEQTRQAAQQYPVAPLSLPEIRALVTPLQYPSALAVEVITGSQLDFVLDEQQARSLLQEGVPAEFLQAILRSLSQHPPVAAAQGPDQGFAPPPETSPGTPFAPPGSGAVPLAPTPGSEGPDIRGTWVATGVTQQQEPFRSVIIFGEMGLFTSATWVGMQSVGGLRGTYRFEGGRLVLQPEGGQPFAPTFQFAGDVIVMDVVNFAPGVRFTRDPNSIVP